MGKLSGEISTRSTLPQLSIIQYLKGSLLIFGLLCCVLTIAQAQRVYHYLDGMEFRAQVELLTWGLIGLQEVLLPSAAFIGAVFVFRKMWRRGYIVTLLTAGYSPWQLGRGLGCFAVLSVCLVGFFTHVAGPDALSQLRAGFIDAFESGKIYPVSVLNLGERGAVNILPETKEAVGILMNQGAPQLIYAQYSDYRRGSDGNWLNLTKVEVAGGRTFMSTDHLKLKVPTQMVKAFPKVLRGTKLMVSTRLDLTESKSLFTYVRRWGLTLLPLVLCMFAMALPGLLSDGWLAFSTAALLGSTHGYFRWIELMTLPAIMNVVAGIVFLIVLFGVAVLCLRRAFWHI